MSFLDIRLQEF